MSNDLPPKPNIKFDAPMPSMPKSQVPSKPVQPVSETEVVNNTSVQRETDNKKNLIIGGLVVVVLAMGGYMAFGNNSGKSSAEVSTTKNVNTVSAPKKDINTSYSNTNNFAVKQGHIVGNEVILRSSPSTTSSMIGTLYDNNAVTILDKYVCNDRSAGILTNAITVYDGATKVYFKYGQGITIIRDDGNTVLADIKYDDGVKVVRRTISKSNMRSIYGDKWYKVRTASGKEGYVYGNYVREY